MTPLIAVMTLLFLLSLVQIAWAQIGYNAHTNSLLCSKPGGHYCVHGSLQGPTMISCISTTTAEIRSCNIELARILLPGYKDMAVCYETAPILGDALCAFNGTGYPRSGKPIDVPETAICSDFPAGSSALEQDPDGDSMNDDLSYGTEAQPKAIYPNQHDHDHNQDPVAVPAPRKRAESESESEPVTASTSPTTMTTRPDDEKGSIQPITPTDSVIDVVPVTPTTTTRPDNEKGSIQPITPSPAATQSDSACAGQLWVRLADPKATGPVYVTECVSGSMTLMPTPTFRRPRLGDKCWWTPTPLYKTGAGVVRSSSTSSASASVTESVSGATTSAVKDSAAAVSVERAWFEVGFVVLLEWVVGWGLV